MTTGIRLAAEGGTVAEPLEVVPSEALWSSLEPAGARERDRRLDAVRRAVAVVAERLETPAGRRGVEAVARLLAVLATTSPRVAEGLGRGFARAAAALETSSTPSLRELARLTRSRELRRGLWILIELIAGLGEASASASRSGLPAGAAPREGVTRTGDGASDTP